MASTVLSRKMANDQAYVNRVFVRKNGIEVFGHDDDLFRIVGETHSRSFYEIFANGDVVSGIIALVVTILIVPTFLLSFWTGVAVTVPEGHQRLAPDPGLLLRQSIQPLRVESAT